MIPSLESLRLRPGCKIIAATTLNRYQRSEHQRKLLADAFVQVMHDGDMLMVTHYGTVWLFEKREGNVYWQNAAKPRKGGYLNFHRGGKGHHFNGDEDFANRVRGFDAVTILRMFKLLRKNRLDRSANEWNAFHKLDDKKRIHAPLPGRVVDPTKILTSEVIPTIQLLNR